MVLTLSQLNSKEWARSDKWDVRFRSGQGPNGFGSGTSGWLPATDLSTPVFNISSFDWSSGHRTFAIPKALDYADISMTLLDDEQRNIKKFLKEWCEKAFPETGGIQYLSEVVKVLDVTQLNAQNEAVEMESYIVFPTGSVASVLNSSSSILSYPVSFKVAGYIRK